MVGEFFGGVSAFKTMMDIAKTMKEMDTANTRNAAVISLQETILDAQSAYSDLTDRVRELEEQVRRFETWEAEKKRYELKQLYPGFLAYAVKETERGGEPLHAICANCYENGLKSILQSNGKLILNEHAFVCLSCKSVFPSRRRDMVKMITDPSDVEE